MFNSGLFRQTSSIGSTVQVKSLFVLMLIINVNFIKYSNSFMPRFCNLVNCGANPFIRLRVVLPSIFRSSVAADFKIRLTIHLQGLFKNRLCIWKVIIIAPKFDVYVCNAFSRIPQASFSIVGFENFCRRNIVNHL